MAQFQLISHQLQFKTTLTTYLRFYVCVHPNKYYQIPPPNAALCNIMTQQEQG